jgi:hypothetical protein
MNRALLALSLVAVGMDAASFGAPIDRGDMRSISQAANCQVTTAPNPPFVPPAPYPATVPAGIFWYGTDDLWTTLRVDGTWHGLPRNANGFRQKVFWWHPGFDGRIERTPELTVTGRRLDAAGSFVRPPPATNAESADFGGWTILTGIDVPTAGCWELTGSYRSSIVTFIVSIAP